MDLKLGIEFDEETIKKIEELREKVEKLNDMLEKLKSYNVDDLPVYLNYITINGKAFAGNRDEARKFALMIRDMLIEDENRE